MQRLARAAYSLLLWLALPAYVGRLWWRGRIEPLYRHALGERFGWYRESAPVAGWVWIHAVSLGETRAASALIDALRARQPAMRLLLTHGTATGRAAGAGLLRPGDRQAWLPYDTPGAVDRFIGHFRPAVGVLMETEIWPNLLHSAARRGLPMVLANARLSERSAKRGGRLPALLGPAVRSLSRVLAQTDEDAQRLRTAGAPQVAVCGNLKFDVEPDADLLARGAAWRAAVGRPIVLAASTRQGEEATLLDCWRQRPGVRPLLLIVPRHPQRFDEVAGLVEAAGLSLLRRSLWADQPPPQAAELDVWLGDSMGEMAAYFGCAELALLGGSFEPFGGQNLIEAAACGCPVVMGPHTFNFAEASQAALREGAAQRVEDMNAAVALVIEATAAGIDPRARAAATTLRRDAALAFAARHRGAASRMADAIAELMR